MTATVTPIEDYCRRKSRCINRFCGGVTAKFLTWVYDGYAFARCPRCDLVYVSRVEKEATG